MARARIENCYRSHQILLLIHRLLCFGMPMRGESGGKCVSVEHRPGEVRTVIRVTAFLAQK
jgi:hypothetical protein